MGLHVLGGAGGGARALLCAGTTDELWGFAPSHTRSKKIKERFNEEFPLRSVHRSTFHVQARKPQFRFPSAGWTATRSSALAGNRARS